MSASEETLPQDAWLRRNPSHPGGFVSDWMENSSGVHMTIAATAGKLGVSVPALRRVLNGQAGISVTLALKLEAAGWGQAEAWLRKQAAYDLARARRRLGQWPEKPEGVAAGTWSARARLGR